MGSQKVIDRTSLPFVQVTEVRVLAERCDAVRQFMFNSATKVGLCLVEAHRVPERSRRLQLNLTGHR